MQETHLEELKKAKQLLENPGVAIKIADLVGKPIEMGFKKLPQKWNENIGKITQASLQKAVDAAIFTMKDTPGEKSSNFFHKLVVAASGGVGGFFGFPALAVELPISTTIMLRSVADIARSEGFNVECGKTKASCIEVFALGGPTTDDDAAESGYFATRAALGRAVSEAAEHIAVKGLEKEGAPALVRLIIKVAERFSIQVSEKAAAQAVPAIGAIGGATINTIFIDHFQDMARGHFIVKRLETTYDPDFVKETYLKI